MKNDLINAAIRDKRMLVTAKFGRHEYDIPLEVHRQNKETFLTWFGGSVSLHADVQIMTGPDDVPLGNQLAEELYLSGYRHLTFSVTFAPGVTRMLLIDFPELKRRIPFENILLGCGFLVNFRRGDQVRGPCVIHGSKPTSRVFSADLGRGIWQCFKCHKTGGWLEFYMEYRGVSSPFAAAKMLGKVFNIEVPWREVQ